VTGRGASDVQDVRVGDAVIAVAGLDGVGSFVTTLACLVTPKARSQLSFEEAATIPPSRFLTGVLRTGHEQARAASRRACAEFTRAAGGVRPGPPSRWPAG